MNRSDFHSLVDNLRHKLYYNTSMGARRNGVVEPEFRVAVVPRILAGASYLDILLIWHIARSSLYDVFDDTIRVMIYSLQFQGFPDTNAKCCALASGFHHSRTKFMK